MRESNHTCAIDNAAAKCWGRNDTGQLGNGFSGSFEGDSRRDSNSPQQVIGLTFGVTAIAVGDNSSCAIQDGVVKCWGDGRQGQLGLGDSGRFVHSEPAQVLGLMSNVTAIAAAFARVCAIQDGAVKCWGTNAIGRFGNRSIPGQIQGLTTGVTAIAVGY